MVSRRRAKLPIVTPPNSMAGSSTTTSGMMTVPTTGSTSGAPPRHFSTTRCVPGSSTSALRGEHRRTVTSADSPGSSRPAGGSTVMPGGSAAASTAYTAGVVPVLRTATVMSRVRPTPSFPKSTGSFSAVVSAASCGSPSSVSSGAWSPLGPPSTSSENGSVVRQPSTGVYRTVTVMLPPAFTTPEVGLMVNALTIGRPEEGGGGAGAGAGGAAITDAMVGFPVGVGGAVPALRRAVMRAIRPAAAVEERSATVAVT